MRVRIAQLLASHHIEHCFSYSHTIRASEPSQSLSEKVSGIFRLQLIILGPEMAVLIVWAPRFSGNFHAHNIFCFLWVGVFWLLGGRRRANFYGREDFSEEGMGPKEFFFAERVLRSMHEDLSEGVLKVFCRAARDSPRFFLTTSLGNCWTKH